MMINKLIEIAEFLEGHDKLAGWAQFFGAMLTLVVTYLTVFMPVWRRKRQLKRSAWRLLGHGFEALESYHRTSAYFLPTEKSLRLAALSMKTISEEISRFPIYELDDQGPRSIARRLVSTSGMMNSIAFLLEDMAKNFVEREGDEEEREIIRSFIEQQMNFMKDLISGKELKRPEFPNP